jgi:predicted nuclease of restriction endonuclease-like (RecB) superfamily
MVEGAGMSKAGKRDTKASMPTRKLGAGKALKAKRASKSDFDEVLRLIETARTRAFVAVNTTVIQLYWSIGEYISRKIADEDWGKGTVTALADHIRRRHPGRSGFSASNLWRMRQFFELYRGEPKLAPVVRELPWTHNMLIMSRCKREEEREFYLRLCRRERWGKRELERQLAGSLFERTVLSPPKLAPAVRELHPDAAAVFKDTYLIDFLDLPTAHSAGRCHRRLWLNTRPACRTKSSFRPNRTSSTNWPRNRRH